MHLFPKVEMQCFPQGNSVQFQYPQKDKKTSTMDFLKLAPFSPKKENSGQLENASRLGKTRDKKNFPQV